MLTELRAMEHDIDDVKLQQQAVNHVKINCENSWDWKRIKSEQPDNYELVAYLLEKMEVRKTDVEQLKCYITRRISVACLVFFSEHLHQVGWNCRHINHKDYPHWDTDKRYRERACQLFKLCTLIRILKLYNQYQTNANRESYTKSAVLDMKTTEEATTNSDITATTNSDSAMTTNSDSVATTNSTIRTNSVIDFVKQQVWKIFIFQRVDMDFKCIEYPLVVQKNTKSDQVFKINEFGTLLNWRIPIASLRSTYDEVCKLSVEAMRRKRTYEAESVFPWSVLHEEEAITTTNTARNNSIHSREFYLSRIVSMNTSLRAQCAETIFQCLAVIARFICDTRMYTILVAQEFEAPFKVLRDNILRFETSMRLYASRLQEDERYTWNFESHILDIHHSAYDTRESAVHCIQFIHKVYEERHKSTKRTRFSLLW